MFWFLTIFVQKKELELFFDKREDWQRWHRILYEAIYKTPFLDLPTVTEEKTTLQTKYFLFVSPFSIRRKIIIKVEPINSTK